MHIGILRIGQVDQQVISRILENLRMAFPEATCTLIDEILPIPEEALNSARQQYHSDYILNKIRVYAEKQKDFDKILGIIDADIFVPNLNFVFGEAECPGKAALISLRRLRPEYYGSPPKNELFIERGAKEALHELGHTFGLRHCSNPFCVMYFSNSIFETDRKQSLFCNKCVIKLEKALENLG
ncbi:MAG: archaemetzincin family Zn-dependent metalloprotease [Candidatus Bathyarchaeia archaeon]